MPIQILSDPYRPNISELNACPRSQKPTPFLFTLRRGDYRQSDSANLRAQGGESRGVVGVNGLAAGSALSATLSTSTALGATGTATRSLAASATGTTAASTAFAAVAGALLPLAGGTGELAVEFDKDLFLLGGFGLGAGGLFL